VEWSAKRSAFQESSRRRNTN